jgi:hypothetical protein
VRASLPRSAAAQISKPIGHHAVIGLGSIVNGYRGQARRSVRAWRGALVDLFTTSRRADLRFHGSRQARCPDIRPTGVSRRARGLCISRFHSASAYRERRTGECTKRNVGRETRSRSSWGSHPRLYDGAAFAAGTGTCWPGAEGAKTGFVHLRTDAGKTLKLSKFVQCPIRVSRSLRCSAYPFGISGSDRKTAYSAIEGPHWTPSANVQ